MTEVMLVGEILRQAREKKGMSVHDVAEATRMKTQHVMDIENNDFSHMAAPVYSKGFVKLYAEAVGLEPEPLVRQYVQFFAPVRTVAASSDTQSEVPRSVPARRLRGPSWAALWRESLNLVERQWEQLGLQFDRVRLPQRRLERGERPAVSRSSAPSTIPWRYLTIAAGILIVLLLALSGVSRYLRTPSTSKPPLVRVSEPLRLVEDPPPSYLNAPVP
jgi:transcriptional regulator with XRE-family HTH domain